MKIHSLTIKTILLITFVCCLLEMPYGYYEFVRIIGCIGFIWLAYHEYQKKVFFTFIVCFIIIILLNPIYKIPLTRHQWKYIDMSLSVGICAWVIIDFSLKYLGSTNKKTQKKELNLFICHCENLFFENGKMTLKEEHKLIFFIIVSMFFKPEIHKTYVGRHQIYKWFDEKYNDNIPEEYKKKYLKDVEAKNMFDALSMLSQQTKIAMILIIHCMIFIDKKPIESEKIFLNAMITYLNITQSLYRILLRELKNRDGFRSIKHIYDETL